MPRLIPTQTYLSLPFTYYIQALAIKMLSPFQIAQLTQPSGYVGDKSSLLNLWPGKRKPIAGSTLSIAARLRLSWDAHQRLASRRQYMRHNSQVLKGVVCGSTRSVCALVRTLSGRCHFDIGTLPWADVDLMSIMDNRWMNIRRESSAWNHMT